MPHQLKNDDVELVMHLPHEHYGLARFDWTGKIVSVKYQGKYVTGTELADSSTDTPCGRGFYNEFDINGPVGYAETTHGDWFHKIGIGLLQKTNATYDFSKPYPIQPAAFEVIPGSDRVTLHCRAKAHNGYAYLLTKEIRLSENGFSIQYELTNTGQKTIITSEYNHNFLATNRDLIGSHYRLRFPFSLQPNRFEEKVDPEALIHFTPQAVHFKGQPTQPFFFSNLSGSEQVNAHWELENHKCKLGISETGSFQTTKVNLWGWGHVVSPELFADLRIPPGQTERWSRTYRIYELP